MRSAAGVLLNGNQRRHATPLRINPSQQMTRALGRDHDHVNICWRNDGFEMNAEPVRDAENFPLGQARLDRGLVEIALCLIRSQNLDPVRLLRGLCGREHSEPVRLCLLGAAAGRVQPDNHVVSAVAEVLGLGVSLASVAEHGDSFALQG